MIFIQPILPIKLLIFFLLFGFCNSIVISGQDSNKERSGNPIVLIEDLKEKGGRFHFENLLFTGEAVEYFQKDGIKVEKKYKNGLLTSIKVYGKNGVLNTQVIYKNRRKEWRQFRHTTTGIPLQEVNYKDGRKHGVVKSWDFLGRLQKLEQWENGKLKKTRHFYYPAIVAKKDTLNPFLIKRNAQVFLNPNNENYHIGISGSRRLVKPNHLVFQLTQQYKNEITLTKRNIVRELIFNIDKNKLKKGKVFKGEALKNLLIQYKFVDFDGQYYKSEGPRYYHAEEFKGKITILKYKPNKWIKLKIELDIPDADNIHLSKKIKEKMKFNFLGKNGKPKQMQ